MPSRLRESLVNAFIGMIATITLLFATGAWATKEPAATHQADIVAIRAKIDSLSAGQQRILDALCDPQRDKPRACTSPR